ncbi:hypothetical protein [Parasitella parasitica]|uniref:Helitron helicase-like domain-containing protein n=1 Tax=Parasitella parasitica TaxID=35722 RepID=A0A0B7N679_9FUNG|nr:hypothetical protein [Parasitella parasitica]
MDHDDQVDLGNNGQQEEIKDFLDAGNVSAAEARWRLLPFWIHREFPSCQRLDVRFPRYPLLNYDEEDKLAEILNRAVAESTLKAWFKYSANYPDDQVAREALFLNFCERYTFHLEKRLRYWIPRRVGFGGTIGRIYRVSPRDIEKYHVRFLLLKIPGATSFEDLNTYEGYLYSSFQPTERARGLLGDDSKWSAAITKTALFQSASFLRKKSYIIIALSGLSDPYQLWLAHGGSMAEVYIYRYQRDPTNARNRLSAISDEIYGHCLLHLNDILADNCYVLQTMEGFSDIFSSVDTRANSQSNHSYTYERIHALPYAQYLDGEGPDMLPFNELQALVYSTIRDAALKENPSSPGGTGTIFVFIVLLNRIRQNRDIAIAVASSGNAALLL